MKATANKGDLSASASELSSDEREKSFTYIFSVEDNHFESSLHEGDYVIAPEHMRELADSLAEIDERIRDFKSPRGLLRRMMVSVSSMVSFGVIFYGLNALFDSFVQPLPEYSSSILVILGSAYGLFLSPPLRRASRKRKRLQLETFDELVKKEKALPILDEHFETLKRIGVTEEQLNDLEPEQLYETMLALNKYIILFQQHEESVLGVHAAEQRADWLFEQGIKQVVMREVSRVLAKHAQEADDAKRELLKRFGDDK